MASLFRTAGFRTAAAMSVSFLAGVTPGFEELSYDGVRTADETVGAAREWFANRNPDRRFLFWIHLWDVHGSLKRQLHPSNEHRSRLREHFRDHAE